MTTRSTGEAMRRVPAGARVVATPCGSTPTTLLGALGVRSREVEGLVVSAGLLLGEATYADDVLAGRLGMRSWQLSAATRRLAAAGVVDYVPARLGDVVAAVTRDVDVALVRITPPDRDGRCSLGPSASYGRALVEHAGLRLAEVDPTLPRTRGDDVTLDVDVFDVVVDSQDPTPTVPPARVSPAADVIGDRVVALLPEACTLQLGIGAVPEAVARSLVRADVGDLRLLGAVSDAMVPLVADGRVRGEVTTVELLGSRPVLELAEADPRVRMASSATVHDPRWLGSHDRLVAVCSALAVDLSGQVASEDVAGHVVSGIGGAADFFAGAGLSDGGLRVVALTATTTAGASRIVATLDAAVTLPRHAVDLVVTEHGVADLRGRSLAERAGALAAIAAPEHRGSLREAR